LKIKEFEDRIHCGDYVFILGSHQRNARQWGSKKYEFIGYVPGCKLNCFDCPGEIKLKEENGETITGCFRSTAHNNIRLEILTKILPDELFEV
jgi:hypothetical protein